MTFPTVQDVLDQTAVGCGWHDWPTEGGSIMISTADLRLALEDAFDEHIPDWVHFVEIED